MKNSNIHTSIDKVNTELVTVGEAAKELGLTRVGVYKAIQQGRLAAEEVLGKLVIRRDVLERFFVDEGRQKAGRSRSGSVKKAAIKGVKKGSKKRLSKTVTSKQGELFKRTGKGHRGK
jgi:excisionase family DNA binding protein